MTEKPNIKRLRDLGNNPISAKTKVVSTPNTTTATPKETRGNNPIPPKSKPKK